MQENPSVERGPEPLGPVGEELIISISKHPADSVRREPRIPWGWAAICGGTRAPSDGGRAVRKTMLVQADSAASPDGLPQNLVMFGWVRRAGVWTKKSIVRAGRRVGRVRLFTAVTLALITGIAVAAQWLLSRVIVTNQNQAAPIDITKLALTVVGGVGGAVALVVAYRRQRDLEQNRFVERFGAAAAQLGSTDVAVRIAGVYAMAGVADESPGSNRQQCIDVLCGYMRLPYDTAHGGSGRTKLVTKTKQDEKVDLEETTEYRQNDREVRKTIVRVIAEHLRDSSTPDWRKNTFDFRTAYLEDADFNHVRCEGTMHFEASAFSGTANFIGTTFSGNTNFGKATFAGYTSFRKATFSGAVKFHRADFGTNDVSFIEPREWDPPPQFDWDQEVSLNPSNVLPEAWPPTLV
ncbi:pentapeptide repeat-containing protein [Nocardia sp. NPDC004340]